MHVDLRSQASVHFLTRADSCREPRVFGEGRVNREYRISRLPAFLFIKIYLSLARAGKVFGVCGLRANAMGSLSPICVENGTRWTSRHGASTHSASPATLPVAVSPTPRNRRREHATYSYPESDRAGAVKCASPRRDTEVKPVCLAEVSTPG